MRIKLTPYLFLISINMLFNPLLSAPAYQNWLDELTNNAKDNNPAFRRYLELEAPENKDPANTGQDFLNKLRLAFHTDYITFETNNAMDMINHENQNDRRNDMLQIPTDRAPWLCETGQIKIPEKIAQNGITNCFDYISKMTPEEISVVINNNQTLIQRVKSIVEDETYSYAQNFVNESPSLPYMSFRKAHKIISMNLLHSPSEGYLDAYLTWTRRLLSRNSLLVEKGVNFYVFSNALNLVAILAQDKNKLPFLPHPIPSLNPQEQSLCAGFKLEWGKSYYTMKKNQALLKKTFPHDHAILDQIFNPEGSALWSQDLYQQYCDASNAPASEFQAKITQINHIKQAKTQTLDLEKSAFSADEQAKIKAIIQKIDPNKGYIDTLTLADKILLKSLGKAIPNYVSDLHLIQEIADYAPNIERNHVINGKINLVNLLIQSAQDPNLKNQAITQDWLDQQPLSKYPITHKPALLNQTGDALCFDTLNPLVDTVKCIPVF